VPDTEFLDRLHADPPRVDYDLLPHQDRDSYRALLDACAQARAERPRARPFRRVSPLWWAAAATVLVGIALFALLRTDPWGRAQRQPRAKANRPLGEDPEPTANRKPAQDEKKPVPVPKQTVRARVVIGSKTVALAGVKLRLYVGRRVGDVLMAQASVQAEVRADGTVEFPDVAMPPGAVKYVHCAQGIYVAQELIKDEPLNAVPIVRIDGTLKDTSGRPAKFLRFMAHPAHNPPLIVGEAGVVDQGLRRFGVYAGPDGSFAGMVPATKLTLKLWGDPVWRAEVEVAAWGARFDADNLPRTIDPVALQEPVLFQYRVEDSDGRRLDKSVYEIGHWSANAWQHGKPFDWTPLSEVLLTVQKPAMEVALHKVIVRPKTGFMIGVPSGAAVHDLDARDGGNVVYRIPKPDWYGRVQFTGGRGMLLVENLSGLPMLPDIPILGPLFRNRSYVAGPISGARSVHVRLVGKGSEGWMTLGGRESEKGPSAGGPGRVVPGWGFPPGRYRALAVTEQGLILGAQFEAKSGETLEVALRPLK